MTTVYEIAPLEEDACRRFTGTATSAHLGPIIVGTMDVDALAYHRSPAKIRSDHMDHFIIRLDRSGADGKMGDEILVKDMGQPLGLPPMRLDGACIIIPRDVMTGMLPRADALHGTRLSGIMGRLLADHMRTLAQAVPSATVEEAPQIVRVIRDMVTACLAPSQDALIQAQPQVAATLIMQARRHIDANLTNPDLSPDRLCRALGLSRSALYTLFEPHHGVNRYIQERRLLRIREHLCDPAERRRIGEIAFTYGFTSEAHFSRAFRRTFGCSPSEMRAGAYAGAMSGPVRSNAADGTDDGFPEWLRRLRA